MAEGPRRSIREIKVRKDKDFEYDEECLSEILQNSGKSDSIWQQRDTLISPEVDLSDTVQSGWSVLNYLPIYFNPLDYAPKSLEGVASDNDLQLGNRSQSSEPNDSPAESVNKSATAGRVSGGGLPNRRLKTSKGCDF